MAGSSGSMWPPRRSPSANVRKRRRRPASSATARWCGRRRRWFGRQLPMVNSSIPPSGDRLPVSPSTRFAALRWLDAVHAYDRDRARNIWQTSVEKHASFETEFRIRRKDGVYVWHQARGNAVLEDDGSVREWVGICIDIDDRKQAAEQRELLNRSVEQALDSAGERQRRGQRGVHHFGARFGRLGADLQRATLAIRAGVASERSDRPAVLLRHLRQE